MLRSPIQALTLDTSIHFGTRGSYSDSFDCYRLEDMHYLAQTADDMPVGGTSPSDIKAADKKALKELGVNTNRDCDCTGPVAEAKAAAEKECNKLKKETAAATKQLEDNKKKAEAEKKENQEKTKENE